MRTSTHQTPSAPQISWPTKQSRNNWRRCQDIDFLRIIDAVWTLKILKFCFLKMFANSRCNVDICAEHFTVHTSCGSDNTFKKVLFSLRKVSTERFIPCTSKLWTDRQNYHMKCHTPFSRNTWNGNKRATLKRIPVHVALLHILNKNV